MIRYKENPYSRPSRTLAMSVEDGEWYNQDYEDEFPEVEVLLFETPIRGLESLIGGIYVRQGVIEDDTDRWVVEGSAALTGYGPLLYDIAARVVGAPISPSKAQSDHAERFWSRQAGRRIRNLSDAEFEAKYGASYIPVRDPGPMRQRFQDAVKQSFGYGIPLDRSVRTMPQSNPYKAVIPIVSGIAYVRNTTDLAGRHIPEKYLAGLPPELQKQRIRELTESRDAYKSGDFSELATDRAARKMGLVKESSYTTVAKKRGIEWRGSPEDMAARVLQYYGEKPTAAAVSEFAEALKKVFAKGLAAWKSGGHRPGATAQNWAVARVNSVAVGGKAAWTADKKQFAVLPEAVRKKIVAKLPEVYKALSAQGRQKDVASIQGKAKANPILDPELKRLVGLHLAENLKKPLTAHARKIMAKYGSRATSDDVIGQVVAEGQEAIIRYFYEKTDDSLIRYYLSTSRTLRDARPIAMNIGQKAVGAAVKALMSITGSADLAFWERLAAERRLRTRPGAPLISDKELAESLGITLDDLNRKKFEHRILSSTSYDRLLGLGRESARSAAPRELTEVLTETAHGPEGMEAIAGERFALSPRTTAEEDEPEVEGQQFLQETFRTPEESLYLKRLGLPEGFEALESEVVRQVLQNLSPSDLILLQSYIGGNVAPGMGRGEFERAIEGGWDNRLQQRLPGLKDRIHEEITAALTAVAELPAAKKAAIVEGDLTVQQALATAAVPQIAGPTAARTPAARLALRRGLG